MCKHQEATITNEISACLLSLSPVQVFLQQVQPLFHFSECDVTVAVNAALSVLRLCRVIDGPTRLFVSAHIWGHIHTQAQGC